MSRRQQKYARQPADFEHARQNKYYKGLENNLGFDRIGENNRQQTHAKFTITLKELFSKHAGITPEDMNHRTNRTKIICIINNYLLFNINWIFEEYANGMPAQQFSNFIENGVLKCASRIIDEIDIDFSVGYHLVDRRMIANTISVLLDTLHAFTPAYDEWKIRTGYVAQQVPTQTYLLIQQ